MDDDGLYTERLGTLLTRLQLRASLYTTPDRPEDLAAMIIEQVRSFDVFFYDGDGDDDDDGDVAADSVV